MEEIKSILVLMGYKCTLDLSNFDHKFLVLSIDVKRKTYVISVGMFNHAFKILHLGEELIREFSSSSNEITDKFKGYIGWL